MCVSLMSFTWNNVNKHGFRRIKWYNNSSLSYNMLNVFLGSKRNCLYNRKRTMLELEGTLEIILSNSSPTQYGSPLQYPFISLFFFQPTTFGKGSTLSHRRQFTFGQFLEPKFAFSFFFNNLLYDFFSLIHKILINVLKAAFYPRGGLIMKWG